MDKNYLVNKMLVIAIIMLFIGSVVVPTISGTKEIKTTNVNEFVEYIRFDDFEDYYVGEPPKSERGWSTSGVDENQFIEARVDPLDSENMVMLIHSSSENPGVSCFLLQENFGPADEYIIHYRIFTPQLSMERTIYENFFEGEQRVVIVHRRTDQIRWGSDHECGDFYEFIPQINPSTTRWIEEEITLTVHELRVWHDNSIDAVGGYCVQPVNGINTWKIRGYRPYTQNFYIDDFWITRYNQPPDTPQKPSGQTSGKVGVKYTYTTYTYDPNDDQVLYKWEWGDGTYSNWLGPHDSGEMATAKHSWSEGSYSIRVKAKDIYEEESDWSEPLTVTMPKNRMSTYNSLFLRFLEHFPILQKIFLLQRY